MPQRPPPKFASKKRSPKVQKPDPHAEVNALWAQFQTGVIVHLDVLSKHQDPEDFQSFVYLFKDRLCGWEFWETVFQNSVGTNHFDYKFIDTRNSKFFWDVVGNLSKEELPRVLISLAKHTMESIRNFAPSVNNNLRVQSHIAFKIVHHIITDGPQIFPESHDKMLVEYLCRHLERSKLIKYLSDGLFEKWFSKVSSQSLNSFIDTAVRTDLATNDRCDEWIHNGVHSILTTEQRTRLFDSNFRRKETPPLSTIVHRLDVLKVEPTDSQREFMTDLLLKESSIHNISHVYRDNPTLYVQETVREFLVKEIKKQLSPDPLDLANSLLNPNGSRHLSRMHPFMHPFMIMGMNSPFFYR